MNVCLVARGALSVAGLLGAAAALAHPLLKPPSVAPAVMASGNVQYYGGPVLSKVKVYAVLWGDGVDQEVASGIGDFYAATVDSTYLDWLDLYNTKINATDGRAGTQQDIGRGSYGGLIKIQPQASDQLDQAAIEGELDRQIDAGVLPKPDADTIYMIHFPASTSINISWGGACDTWCADHEGYHSPKHGDVFYAMMPECLAGCGGGSAFASISEAASHELVEAITDPACPTNGQPNAYPAGWLTTDGQEIGDLCAWVGTSLAAKTTTYTVQSIWSNATGSCNNGPFTSP